MSLYQILELAWCDIEYLAGQPFISSYAMNQRLMRLRGERIKASTYTYGKHSFGATVRSR